MNYSGYASIHARHIPDKVCLIERTPAAGTRVFCRGAGWLQWAYSGSMEQAVILYDSSCGLCSRSVRFVLRHDRHGQFLFAGLESETGRGLREHTDVGAASPASVLLAEKGDLYRESTAALLIVRRLGLPWSLLYGGVIVPRPLRDAVYRLVARHRYRWFGRRDSCDLPDPRHKERFLP